jgi:hypothetical protein
VPSSDLAHHGPRHQCLFNDPRLLVLAPPPSALDPENLPIHLCVTLRLALRSHPRDDSAPKQGGRPRTVTTNPARSRCSRGPSIRVVRPLATRKRSARTSAGAFGRRATATGAAAFAGLSGQNRALDPLGGTLRRSNLNRPASQKNLCISASGLVNSIQMYNVAAQVGYWRAGVDPKRNFSVFMA